MSDLAFWHRLQFAFTITYHYLFPQLTMGLAWFLVYWKWRALRTGDERYAAAARFRSKISLKTGSSGRIVCVGRARVRSLTPYWT